MPKIGLRVPKLELILKGPKLPIPLKYQLNASGIYFHCNQAMVVTISIAVALKTIVDESKYIKSC